MLKINLFKKIICVGLTVLMFSMQLLPAMANDTFYDFSDAAQEQFNAQSMAPVPAISSTQTPEKKQKKKKSGRHTNLTPVQETSEAQNTSTVQTPEQNAPIKQEPTVAVQEPSNLNITDSDQNNTNKQEPETVQQSKTVKNSTLKGGVVYIFQGAVFQAVLQSPISSESIAKDDTIASVLSADWVYNGVLIAPEGSIVYGKALDAKKSGNFYKNGEISIVFNELLTPTGEKLVLESNVVTVRVDSKRAKKITANVTAGIVTGVAVGAVACLMGAGPSIIEAVAVGAGIGALGGIVGAATHKGEAVEIPAGTGINVRLTKPMQAVPYNHQG